MENQSLWLVYQPLIVGLGAVVLATLGNTLLEWFKHRLSRRHSAEALRRALLEELKQARDTCELNVSRSDGNEEGSFLIPIARGYPIFEANIGNLGLLRPNEVGAVVRAYGMLEAQTETYGAIGTFHGEGGPVLHAVIDGKWQSILASAGRGLTASLNRSIDVLEGRANSWVAPPEE